MSAGSAPLEYLNLKVLGRCGLTASGPCKGLWPLHGLDAVGVDDGGADV
ncbi:MULTISPECIES: hypothetical protein [unclassified Streptomyces]